MQLQTLCFRSIPVLVRTSATDLSSMLSRFLSVAVRTCCMLTLPDWYYFLESKNMTTSSKWAEQWQNMSGSSFCLPKQPCPAGQKVNNFGTTVSPGVVCEPCERELYQPDANLLPACFPKAMCRAGEYVVSYGDSTSKEVECKACSHGAFTSRPNHFLSCKPKNRCQGDEGFLSWGLNNSSKALCALCDDGSCVNPPNHTQPCTTCSTSPSAAITFTQAPESTKSSVNPWRWPLGIVLVVGLVLSFYGAIVCYRRSLNKPSRKVFDINDATVV
eukprot:m.54408 g.54408  ORF g.54408 m.54408 type:complete len:273 (+) comp13621_c0_seq8:530-1348(+)